MTEVIANSDDSPSADFHLGRVRDMLLYTRPGGTSMRRRKFIAALAGMVGAFRLRPSSAQIDSVRRIGILMGLNESSPESRGFVAAFVGELARLGWVDGRNARIEQRWTNADTKRASAFATELVASQPDVILCATTPVTAALHRATGTIPIVFTIVSDPVGAGFVAGLPHPGGNITGFTHTDPGLGGKWLGLLKEIAPGIKRAGGYVQSRHGARWRKVFPRLVRGRRSIAGGRASRLACTQR
jgi:ABC-type uncharacterized transport system substrate-binding protein